MGTGYNPRIVTDGLVLCLDAANARSYPGTGTTWTDRSKSGNNGSIANAQFSSDNGGVFSFDGTDDYVQYSTSGFPTGNSSHTWMSWIYSRDDKGGLFSWGSLVSYQARLYGIRSTNGNLRFAAYSSDFDTGVIIPQNKWTFVTGIWNSPYHYTYLDGVLKATHSRGTLNTVLGGYDTMFTALIEAGKLFDGLCGQSLLYNRALTAEQIRQNYLATKERYA